MKIICVGDRRSIRYALSSAMIVGFSHFCTAQQTVSVSSYWGGRQAAVSYTFDNGLQDQYTLAWPQLRKRGLKVSLLSMPQTSITASTPTRLMELPYET